MSEFVPGIYEMTEAEYHGDPVPGGSLSSTGARKLLPPSCPARFRYEQDHPVHKSVFDFGTAAHRLVLGVGTDIELVEAENWRTKAAQEKQKEARDRGLVPLLTSEWQQVEEMAFAIGRHPLAAAALDPARGGKPEQSLFAQDDASGVWLRARLDWMPDPNASMRPVIFDYKTTRSANPASFAKSMADFGYHIQAAFYADLYYQLTGVDAPFVFICQEKEPPYLVTVCQPDSDAIRAGRDAYRQAIDTYAACAAVDEWPGYTSEIATISLPPWARAREEYA